MILEKQKNNTKVVILGQTVLKYQVPFDVYNAINNIYENKYPILPKANKQLIGKIEKEHSLYYQGDNKDIMQHHNLLTHDVLNWFENTFKHYLEFNRITYQKKKLNSVWINQMFENEYNPVHVHQGSLYTGLSSVMILKVPESFGVEYSSKDEPQNGKLQIMGAAAGQFSNTDYCPEIKERDFFIFPYDVRHCVYPFNGPGYRRTLSANCDVAHNPIQNRARF